MTPLERRLKLLKAEIDADIPQLLPELEKGARIVLVTDSELGKDLQPDDLRQIGGIAVLCNHYYGAAFIFVSGSRVSEFKAPPKT
jgi:hypothetical protein